MQNYILPAALYGHETGSQILRENGLRVFDGKVWKGVF
jgi:hypothetical protein